jgi:hypothetical protein
MLLWDVSIALHSRRNGNAGSARGKERGGWFRDELEPPALLWDAMDVPGSEWELEDGGPAAAIIAVRDARYG